MTALMSARPAAIPPPPEGPDESGRDYARIAAAIGFLESAFPRRPSLGELASALGLSPGHLHRLFHRWAGITPQAFMDCLSLEIARNELAEGASVLDAALEAGMSGPGRLHDLTVRLEALSPGEMKRAGAGLTLAHGWHASPFGPMLLVTAPRGLAGLAFADEAGNEAVTADLLARWPGAHHVADAAPGAALAARLFRAEAPPSAPLQLIVSGTTFQTRVWRALLALPPGTTTTYGALAMAIGKPGAARAVGSAVGANPIAWLIPCHRVLRHSGALGGYHWGLTRKRAMLVHERAGQVR